MTSFFFYNQMLWVVWFIWGSIGLTAVVDALRRKEKPGAFFWRHWWHVLPLVLLEWLLGGSISILLDVFTVVSGPTLEFLAGQLAGVLGFVGVAFGWALLQRRRHLRWKARKGALDEWNMRSQRLSVARATPAGRQAIRRELAVPGAPETVLVVEGARKEWLEAASQLTGTTLLVYWYLVANRSKSVGPREVQRALGFRSPSTGLFHLEKLTQMNLVQTDGAGSYRSARIMKVGPMRSFISVSGFLLPKSVLYALLTTLLLVASGTILFPLIGWLLSLAWVPGVFALAIFVDEALVLWQLRPHFERQNPD